jgi:hypothetical protein
MPTVKKLPSLEVKVLAGAFVGEPAKLVKQQMKLDPDVKYRVKINFVAKDGAKKEVFKNIYGADLAFVDDGIQRNYTPLESFYDLFFPLLDIASDFTLLIMDPENPLAGTFSTFAILGVVFEIGRALTMISYIDWKMMGNTSMKDYPIVGHVFFNLLHSLLCDVPIAGILTIMAVTDESGGMPIVNVVCLMCSILNLMRAFIHMNTMKDFLDDLTIKALQNARRKAEDCKKIRPSEETMDARAGI